MFKNLISFATILFAISFNNSESACHLCFDRDSYGIVENCYSITDIPPNAFTNMINHNVGKKCFTVDTIDYDDKNSNKVIFKGVKTLKTCEYVELEGLGNFKPNIIFDCGNNNVNFTKIVGNNINSFKLISKNPIKIKSWISVDTTNNKMKVHNTKHKPIIGAISVTPPYSYFVLSMKAE